MHNKPIYGGKIDSDHGNRRLNVCCITEDGDLKTGVRYGAAQDMDLVMHARPFCPVYL